MSPGAALAFLIAGPATNVTTFGIMSKLHGRKIAAAFGTAVAIGAIIAGLAVDYLTIEAVLQLHESEHHEHDYLGWLSIALVMMLFLASLFRMGPRGAMSQITSPINH